MKKHSKGFHRNTTRRPSTNMAVPLVHNKNEIERCRKNILPWLKMLLELGRAEWLETDLSEGGTLTVLHFKQEDGSSWRIDIKGDGE